MPARVRFLAALAAWQVGVLIAFGVEVSRIQSRLLHDATPGTWWNAPAYDGTFLLPILLLGPFCLGVKVSPPWMDRGQALLNMIPGSRKKLLSAGLVALTSLLVSWSSSQLLLSNSLPASSNLPQAAGAAHQRIGETLPLVQDEFSYLLQARAVLEGRWSWPGPQRAPEIFHQLHVLNEGQFASRYFPGTGLWIAPWLAIGHPVWGSRCAGMLVSLGLFCIGYELKGIWTGLLAGFLTALAPGLAIFNNLLLAHSPGLVALVLFLYFMLRFLRNGSWINAMLAGCGLSGAMLCRPLTAAAIGLPFGLWFLWHWLASEWKREDSSASRPLTDWRYAAVGLTVPIFCGLALIAWQNRALTGDWRLTPYQLYTQLHTPRHAFGFQQAQGLSAGSSRQILTRYNDWAENLNGPLAITRSLQRLRGSLAWSLGIVPLTMTAVFFLLTFPWQLRGMQLILMSIVCLHLAHVPYWLSGMLEHHYVLESGPLWILIFAVVSTDWLAWSFRNGRCCFPLWWGALLAASLVVNLLPIGPQGKSRLSAGWKTFLQPTAGYRHFERELAQTELKLPALIIVTPGPADLHVQFVRNQPPFDAAVLVAMERPDLYSFHELALLFPDRHLYQYDSAARKMMLKDPVHMRDGEVSP